MKQYISDLLLKGTVVEVLSENRGKGGYSPLFLINEGFRRDEAHFRFKEAEQRAESPKLENGDNPDHKGRGVWLCTIDFW